MDECIKVEEIAPVCNGVIDYMMKEIGLSDWDITLCVVSPDLLEDNYEEVLADIESKEAEIRISGDVSTRTQAEKIACHALAHVYVERFVKEMPLDEYWEGVMAQKLAREVGWIVYKLWGKRNGHAITAE